MEKTNHELWEEALRTADLLRILEPTLKPMERALFQGNPLIELNKIPVDYVSDAQILVRLLLALKDREAKISQ